MLKQRQNICKLYRQSVMSQITTQIDRETTDKLTYIQQQTNQELPEILSAAIKDYHQKLKQKKQKTPFQLLEESGFIGCCSVESDLSVNYKQVLATELEAKC
jgi:predicted metal-dependent hydrolase